MITKLEQEYTIRALDVDLKGVWRPSAILTRMQEIAEDHAIAVGAGRADLVDEKGLAWMLTRLHLKMTKYPALTEHIKVVTWPAKPTKLFFIRHTMFFSEDGEELGRATSLWVLFNIRERYLCRTGEIGENYPYDLAHGVALPEPTKIKMPNDMQHMCSRTVLYSDTDMNGHMNNAKYADWVCELFAPDTLKNDQMSDLRINYIAETYMDDTVDIYCKQVENTFFVCGKRNGDTVFDAAIEWKSNIGGIRK